MRYLLSLVLLLSVVSLVGCDDGAVVTPEVTEYSVVTQTIKPILEELAETGDLESVEDMQSYIEEDLAGVDQALSDALAKDYQELQGMSGADAIKAKAQEMLEKL